MKGPESDNLLLSLHKWAWRQDENFTSEALAHLLRQSCWHEPALAISFIRRLTGDKVVLAEHDCSTLRVRTQSTTKTGRPDIELRGPDTLIFVEVKVQEEVDLAQLGRHRNALEGDQHARRALVLLCRYPSLLAEVAKICDAEICFHQIGTLLKTKRSEIASLSVKCLVEQFLGFLRGRGMTMEQVDASLVTGLLSLAHLMAMAQEAVVGCGGQPGARSAAWDSKGFDFQWQQSGYWAGVYYDPPSLVVQVYGDHVTVNAGSAQEAGFELCGRGPHWHKRLPLEDSDLFDLPVQDQVEKIKRFLGECLQASHGFISSRAS